MKHHLLEGFITCGQYDSPASYGKRPSLKVKYTTGFTLITTQKLWNEIKTLKFQ